MKIISRGTLGYLAPKSGRETVDYASQLVYNICSYDRHEIAIQDIVSR